MTTGSRAPTGSGGRRYGILLPHFGRHARRERLLSSARSIEEYGFDLVSVRDHIVFRPRGLEQRESDYLDAFLTLTAVGAVTERLVLSSAVLIPHRHPIHATLLINTLERIAGPGRVLPVWGIGGFAREFDAIGMVGWDRKALLEENVDIIRSLWTGEAVDHEGTYFKFEDVAIHPTPEGRTMPMWYGGGSSAGVRRAVRLFDGWSTGHMPCRDYRRLRQKMVDLCEEAERPVLDTSVTVLVSPADTVEEGARHIPIEAMGAEFGDRFDTPPSGAFESLDDFDGSVLAGPPDVIAEGVREFHEAGVDVVLFDLRQRFDDWDECLAALGQQVLPLLRSNGDSAVGAAATTRSDAFR
jgi:alkanesulfonate monooxygenase SsuD/methylene tetrahydromethanopterin reductase-like flavin-dependent oxidoreductase (luciferase family)